MTTLTIPLADLPPDPADATDLTALPESDLTARLRDLYAFLGPDAEIAVDEGTVSITLPDPSGYQHAEAERAVYGWRDDCRRRRQVRGPVVGGRMTVFQEASNQQRERIVRCRWLGQQAARLRGRVTAAL